jgi:hypothetical protein
VSAAAGLARMRARSPAPCIRLAPGIPDLRALGAGGFAELAGLEGGLEEEARVRVVSRRPGEVLLCLPLPGTPGEDGRIRSRPRGAGTGWIYLRRYRGASLARRLRVRLTTPRSRSLAARDWNLLCHLRAQGVGAPEPLAVAEEGGSGFARCSVLVTRALEDMLPLPRWLDAHPGERRAARLARALGSFLRRLFDSGVRLPALEPARILASRAPGQECALAQIAQARGQHEHSPVPGLALGRLPELALTSVAGGRLGRPPAPLERARFLAALARRFSRERSLSTRDAARVFRAALGRGLARDERRRLWRAAVGA